MFPTHSLTNARDKIEGCKRVQGNKSVKKKNVLAGSFTKLITDVSRLTRRCNPKTKSENYGGAGG